MRLTTWIRASRSRRAARAAGALSLCAIPLAWLWLADAGTVAARRTPGPSLDVMIAMASRSSILAPAGLSPAPLATTTLSTDAVPTSVLPAASVAGDVAEPAPDGAPRDPWSDVAAPEDGWSGASRRLLARIVDGGPDGAGLYLLDSTGTPDATAAVPLTPFTRKRGSYVGTYRVGFWPEELHDRRIPASLRDGFLKVAPEDTGIALSAHIRLGDFLVHDDGQEDVWPKYVLVRTALVDKLELVLQDLARHGVRASRVRMLSGFRSPLHNAALREMGAAAESRHMYGEAADFIIDADGDGRMDDLNGDWHVDAADARVVGNAVERVERQHPELAGGLGLYAAMGPSGPFVHVDVRGHAARWGSGLGWWERAASSVRSSRGTQATPVRAGHCMAQGASAVLCRGIH